MITDPTFVGLVVAACIRPDDDTPRLVLADWLDDEAGCTTDPDAARAWAAYIRWDCGGQKGAEPDGLLRVVELGGWFGVAPVRRTQSLVLSRGFPGGLCVPWDTWEKVGHLLSWHPDEYEKSGRACPPTACPGVVVTIRGEPTSYVIDYDTATTKRRLSERWPGVKAWHLPDVSRTIENYQQDVVARISGRYIGYVQGGTNYAGTVSGLRTFNERLYGRSVTADDFEK